MLFQECIRLSNDVSVTGSTWFNMLHAQIIATYTIIEVLKICINTYIHAIHPNTDLNTSNKFLLSYQATALKVHINWWSRSSMSLHWSASSYIQGFRQLSCLIVRLISSWKSTKMYQIHWNSSVKARHQVPCGALLWFIWVLRSNEV